MSTELKHISKFMSLVLRHKPEDIGLELSESGWADVQHLIERMNAKGLKVDFDFIKQVVETNDKKRFAFNDDKTKIRASQGHSIEVELGLQEIIPPDILYHGTAARFLESILIDGLKKQSRQHVHLSQTIETATAVGRRHGKPITLIINAKSMYTDAFKFYLSDNNVWLTDSVPVKYITQ